MGPGFNPVLGLVILIAEMHVNTNVGISGVEALVVTVLVIKGTFI